MKDKASQLIRRKIKKNSPKKIPIFDDQLSSPLITNEILLQKYPSYNSSEVSSPEQSRDEPGSMLDYLLQLEYSNNSPFI